MMTDRTPAHRITNTIKILFVVCAMIVSIGLWVVLPFEVFFYAVQQGVRTSVIDGLRHGDTGTAVLPFILIGLGIAFSPLTGWLTHKLLQSSQRLRLAWCGALAVSVLVLPIAFAAYMT